MRLNAGNKGRVIAPADDYPQRFAAECVAALAAARAVDGTMPEIGLGRNCSKCSLKQVNPLILESNSII